MNEHEERTIELLSEIAQMIELINIELKKLKEGESEHI